LFSTNIAESIARQFFERRFIIVAASYCTGFVKSSPFPHSQIVSLFPTFAAMQHPLDNPAWNALISGNSNLALGTDRVKYFDNQVSPYVAFDKNSPENFNLLNQVLPYKTASLFLTMSETEIPAPWKLLRIVPGIQMVHDQFPELEQPSVPIVPLNYEHVPQMIELTKLTNPGPFAAKTIGFGHYYGIFADNKLVAMCGERLHPFEYIEISAVCTHPDHTGKGYSRQLLINQVNRIRAAGAKPFLHVRITNERAIKVYESVGFAKRANVWFYFMVKDGIAADPGY
jgi:ribosomal protein S18 acetylase RimI-like enzyme